VFVATRQAASSRWRVDGGEWTSTEDATSRCLQRVREVLKDFICDPGISISATTAANIVKAETDVPVVSVKITNRVKI
tara:strand:+ start:154 stop:387 length:234 start_codon:yes stop_codon:yes gene_type:complete